MVSLDQILNWPAPNYENPERQDKGYLIGSIILAVVSTIAVGLRLWSRIVIARRPALDDYLIILAWLTNIGLTISFNLVIYRYGGDLHTWDMPPKLSRKYFLMLWVSAQFYFITQGLIKLSLLVLFWNILRRTSNKVKIFVNWILIALISIYTLGAYFVTVFQCDPVETAYDDPMRFLNPDTVSCLEADLVTFIPTLIGAISDFFVAGFPILFLRQLQLPKRQKWILVLVFSLGFLSCAAGVMRVITLYRWQYEEEDIIWYGYRLQVWTTIETGVGIICACVLILQKQFSAQGIYGRKILAGWSRFRSITLSSSSGTTASAFASAPDSGQHAPWQSGFSSSATETNVSKSFPKSSPASQIGISQSYTVSHSEKTFFDSTSV